ncbi:MAG: glutamate--cysteine ligase [Myxococcota bacterium]|nr:glutamate--cysteine ligase [Myxococcota bacterium]
MNGEQPVETLEDLLAYFRAAETPVSDFRIGTEHEKIGVYEDDWSRVPHEGDRGIGVLLDRIADRDDWSRVYEGDSLIALEKQGASITLEPGGQIELSGAPLATIRETCREFNRHVDLVKEVSSDMKIVWLALGADPLHEVAEIPRMPKARYDIMRSYLPSRGALSLDMMHSTATVQANFDYASEADMASKLRMAMGCSPLASALFANSPIHAGRESGFVTRRVEVWQHMDPARCGLLPFVFEPDFGYRAYAEWALDVPMFFVVRDHEYIQATSITFRRFLDEGFQGHQATLGDWDLHLTTLFPEVRLKRVIEVRGSDAVSSDMVCALPALWKGVLYDVQAGEAAWKLVEHFRWDQRQALLVDVARRGLAAEVAGRPVLDLAREFTSIASEGLRRIGSPGETEPDECSFLDPIREHLERGMSPGELMLESWRGEWQGSIDRLIEASRY